LPPRTDVFLILGRPTAPRDYSDFLKNSPDFEIGAAVRHDSGERSAHFEEIRKKVRLEINPSAE
jgi:hypothetical protein